MKLLMIFTFSMKATASIEGIGLLEGDHIEILKNERMG